MQYFLLSKYLCLKIYGSCLNISLFIFNFISPLDLFCFYYIFRSPNIRNSPSYMFYKEWNYSTALLFNTVCNFNNWMHFHKPVSETKQSPKSLPLFFSISYSFCRICRYPQIKKIWLHYYKTEYYRVLIHVNCQNIKKSLYLIYYQLTNVIHVGIQKTLDEYQVCMFESRISGQQCQGCYFSWKSIPWHQWICQIRSGKENEQNPS